MSSSFTDDEKVGGHSRSWHNICLPLTPDSEIYPLRNDQAEQARCQRACSPGQVKRVPARLVLHAVTQRYADPGSLPPPYRPALTIRALAGRTVNQCLQAADDMFQTTVERPSLKRKSFGDIHDQTPKRMALATPLEPPTHATPLSLTPVVPPLHSRTLTPNSAPAESLSFPPPNLSHPQHVNIQPRPLAPGTPATAAPPSLPIPYGQLQPPPTGRRRGRPSRADKSRQLRPLLPQYLTPLAPRTRPPVPINPHPNHTGGSPEASIPLQTAPQETSGSSEQAGSSAVSIPTSHDPGFSKSAKKRGRPSLADKMASVPSTSEAGS